MIKTILWMAFGLSGVHLFLFVITFLLLGRVDIDDVSW